METQKNSKCLIRKTRTQNDSVEQIDEIGRKNAHLQPEKSYELAEFQNRFAFNFSSFILYIHTAYIQFVCVLQYGYTSRKWHGINGMLHFIGGFVMIFAETVYCKLFPG